MMTNGVAGRLHTAEVNRWLVACCAIHATWLFRERTARANLCLTKSPTWKDYDHLVGKINNRQLTDERQLSQSELDLHAVLL